jgi:hypothetical protein
MGGGSGAAVPGHGGPGHGDGEERRVRECQSSVVAESGGYCNAGAAGWRMSGLQAWGVPRGPASAIESRSALVPVSDPLRWKRPAEIRTPSFSWRAGGHFLHAPLGSVSCRHRQTWKSVAKMGRPVWPRLVFGIERSKLWSEWDQDGLTYKDV